MTRNEMLEILQKRQNEQSRFNDATTQHTIDTITTSAIINEEEKTMESKTTFTTAAGNTFTTNETGTYFYMTDVEGKKSRIKKAAYETARKEYELETAQWQAQADAERKAREEKEAADAKATEDAVNKKARKAEKKTEKKEVGPDAEKKERKPRKSKDIAFEDQDEKVTLTAKQVDFILHLSDSTFWENGLDSILWCDVLVDEIGGQFAEKPMTIGAMISTLCEKGLATRTKDKMMDQTTGRSRKGTTFQLTIKGKLIAAKVGLK